MQLILNTDADIDIKRKMSVIEQENFEETFKNKAHDLNNEFPHIDEKIQQNVTEDCIDNGAIATEGNTLKKNSINLIPEENRDETSVSCHNENSKSIAMKVNSKEPIDNTEVECNDVTETSLDNKNYIEKSNKNFGSLEKNQENAVVKENLSMQDDDLEEKTEVHDLISEDMDIDKKLEANNLKLGHDSPKSNFNDQNQDFNYQKADNIILVPDNTEPADDRKQAQDPEPADDREPAEDPEPADDLEPAEDPELIADDLKPSKDSELIAADLKSTEDPEPIANDLEPAEDPELTADDVKPEEDLEPIFEDLKPSEYLEIIADDTKPIADNSKSDSEEMKIDNNDENLVSDIQNLDSSCESEIGKDTQNDTINNAEEEVSKKTEEVKISDECDSSLENKRAENECIINKIIEMTSIIEANLKDEVQENDLPSIDITDSKENITDNEIKNTNEAKIKIKETEKELTKDKQIKENSSSRNIESDKKSSLICKLSNTLDILSDDEDECLKKAESQKTEKQCIQIEDDDDIMLIDEDVSKTIDKPETVDTPRTNKSEDYKHITNEVKKLPKKDTIEQDQMKMETDLVKDETVEKLPPTPPTQKPLLPVTFLKTCKKNLADMTKDELEEFCILKIVESVVDRSNLNEIKTQMKLMAQSIEEYKKKAMLLNKQNRDLQVVLKSVQEEQKKNTNLPITPLKITRSVGMQVFMTDKTVARKKTMLGPNNVSSNTQGNSPANNQNKGPVQAPKPQKANPNQQSIPVPRLVPATTNNSKPQLPVSNMSPKVNSTSSTPNGIRNSPQAQKAVKRPNSKMNNSVTVDLTDDEPPSKVHLSANPPVRLVNPQNLLAPQKQPFSPNINNPRKVYIPISGSQNQVRTGQAIMLKTIMPQGPRPRGILVKPNTNSVRMSRVGNRHPAPLPDCMKQYQPPNWKSLPPAPELKLSKVDNGIVISWKIDGYPDDNHEEIASYQLYAYQETSSPPSTALWKKIGDVKALPLPMACTLTQFMAGYKYYFAVRAVDIRSRLGPFSAPGNILLLNKV